MDPVFHLRVGVQGSGKQGRPYVMSRMDRLSLGFRQGQSNQAHIPALLFASSVVLGKPPLLSVKWAPTMWHLNEIMQVKHQGRCLDLFTVHL